MSARRKARPKSTRPGSPPVRRQYADQPPPMVTDHALLRYLQRIMGIDIDRLRHDLVAQGRTALIETMQNGRVLTPEGAILVIVGGRVVSVLGKEGAGDHFGRMARTIKSGKCQPELDDV